MICAQWSPSVIKEKLGSKVVEKENEKGYNLDKEEDMIDHRVIAILMDLFANGQMSLYELSIRTEMDKEDLLRSMQQVNAILQDKGLDRIELEAGHYRISPTLAEQTGLVFDLFNQQELSLSQEERVIILYLYTFIRKDFISNNHYQEVLNVSRNTTLSDSKQVKHLCSQFSLSLDYTRARGYHLVGQERDKYRLALYAISACLKSTVGSWALDYVLRSWKEESKMEDLRKLCYQLCHFYQFAILEERLEEYLYFLQFLSVRKQRVTLLSEKVSEPLPSSLLDIAKQMSLVAGFSAEDCREWTPYLASLLQGSLEGSDQSTSNLFNDLTVAIVQEMERLSVVRFTRKQELIAGLQKHLVPAYYRLVSNLVTVNSYTEVIKTEHADLFGLVKKALKPLEDHLGFPIPDSEVSYFVVHFGGYMEVLKEERGAYRALVICPNGVSSSLIVTEQLRALFPTIHFATGRAVKAVETVAEEGYDMVFSTVPLARMGKPFYLVSQFMSEAHKGELFHLVSADFPTLLDLPVEIEDLLEVIGQHATIHHPQQLKYELVQILNRTTDKRKEESPMLDQLITKETYAYSDKQFRWQEAIAEAAKPLVANGAIEESYVEAMIAKVDEFGPFIDLGKGVAIPHARPDEGVNRIGMSMLNLEHPVYLADDPAHEIRLLICIAAVDNQSHLRALSHLTTLLREETSLQKLLKAQSFETIQHLLKEEQ